MAVTTSSAGGSISEMAADKITDTAAVVRGGQLREDVSTTAHPVEVAAPVLRPTGLPSQSSSRSFVPIVMVGIAAVLGVVLYFVFAQSPSGGSDGANTTPTPGAPTPSATTGVQAGGTTQGPPSPNPTAGATNPTAGATANPGTPSAPGTIDMTLVSTPAGATVAIDGIVQAGVTPLPLKGLRPDRQLQLVVTLAGYKPYSTKVQAKAGNFPITLEKGSATPRRDPNAPIEKYVEVTTVPIGADVFLEGKKLGKTPTRFKVPNLSKPLHLEVRRPGFHHEERTITSADTFAPKGNDDVLELSYQLVSNLVPLKKPEGQAPPPPSPTPAQENKPPEAAKPAEQPAATNTPPAAEEKPKPKEEEKPAEAKPENPPSEGSGAAPTP
jgi:hypothetical protein